MYLLLACICQLQSTRADHQVQDPGRVFPGMKMAGRMGGRTVTTQNLQVERIDTAKNVVFVRGCVPGPKGGFVRMRDALKKVTWANEARARKGQESLLPNIQTLPLPAGTDKLARELPAVVQRMRVSSA